MASVPQTHYFTLKRKVHFQRIQFMFWGMAGHSWLLYDMAGCSTLLLILRSHTPSTTGRGLEFTQSLHSFVKQHLGRMLNCLVCLADLAKYLTACDNSNLWGSWLQIASLSLQSDPAQITAEEFDVLGLAAWLWNLVLSKSQCVESQDRKQWTTVCRSDPVRGYF